MARDKLGQAPRPGNDNAGRGAAGSSYTTAPTDKFWWRQKHRGDLIRKHKETCDANFNSQLIFCSVSAISVRSSRFAVASPASAELWTR